MSSLDQFLEKFGGTSQPEGPIELPSPKAGGLDAFINRFTGMSDESFFFYGGTVELKFDKADHVYYLVDPTLGNLTEQNGCTRTTHIINASEMLVPWAAKMTAHKMLRIMPTETREDGSVWTKALTLADFTVLVMEAKSAHKDKLDEAADIGKMAHKCLEDSIKYAIANDPEKTVRNLVQYPADDLATNAANSAKSWMDGHHVRWIETETKIYSKEHRYAGTCDGIAICDSCGDPACCPVAFRDRTCLIDWKSSNHLKVDYLYQVASYKHAKMEEFPDLKIEDVFILRLGKNEEEAGKFEPWHLTDEDQGWCFAGFLACLELTRQVDAAQENIKGRRKVIRSVKKEQRETAKAIAKEKAKVEKALAKAEAKRIRDIEKERVKMEARAERERRKNGPRFSDIIRTVDNAIEKASGPPPTMAEAAPIINAALDTFMEKFADTKINIADLPTGIAPLAEDAYIAVRPFTQKSSSGRKA